MRIFINDGVFKQLERDKKKSVDDRELKLIPFDTAMLGEGFDTGSATISVDRYGNMFAGTTIPNKFHHSSLVASEPVFFAGLIKTNTRGELLEIGNQSGHYKPEVKHTIQFLKWLGKKGALSECVDVKIIEDRTVNESLVPHNINVPGINLNNKKELSNNQLSEITYKSWMSKSKAGFFNIRYHALSMVDKLLLKYCKLYSALSPNENMNLINNILMYIDLQQKTHPNSKRAVVVSGCNNK